MRFAPWLAGLALVFGCIGDVFTKEFLPVELRVAGLSEDAVRLRVEVVGELAASTVDRAIDASFGRVVRLQVKADELVTVEVTAFDGEGTVLQRGRIASARSPREGLGVWHVTLVADGAERVVCDGLDNDDNGEVDEDSCAE